MCVLNPGPRCACDSLHDLVRAQERYLAAHPGQPFPEARAGAQTVAMAHARWQVARQDARLAQAELADAQRHSHDAAYVETLASYGDGALSRALAAQEELTGIWQERAATRQEHLVRHGPAVLTGQPADEPTQPVRTDQWDPKTGRHLVTGNSWDEQGWSRAGFHRTSRRDALGYHEPTGTLIGPGGRLPDGRHHTDAGLSREDAELTTADDVVAGTVALPPAPKRTSTARAIADAKRSDKADARTSTVLVSAAPATPTVAPFRSKRAVADALREPGSRWSIERGGTTTPVTVVRSSTTSIWVQPDDAPEGERPARLPIGNQAAWNVHDDGFDEQGQTRVRRIAA